jgi:putative transposase
MDFMHDTLADGRTLRVLTVMDTYTRECVALEVGRSFSGAEVGRILKRAAEDRGSLPQRIRVDNGTEFTSKALDAWAYWNHVELVFSRPGKPVDNAFAESFNATVRRECLSQHWFLQLEDAQEVLRKWRDEYNNDRPHSSLGLNTPTQYRVGPSEAAGRIEARRVADLLD